MFGNLVSNAVRHARRSVALTATSVDSETGGTTVAGQRRARVSVLDDGPGIAPADRERVFARFTRLDDARSRDAGGSGLGLAIVVELLARAGGTVRLDDAPGGGLAAVVDLPLADSPVARAGGSRPGPAGTATPADDTSVS